MLIFPPDRAMLLFLTAAVLLSGIGVGAEMVGAAHADRATGQEYRPPSAECAGPAVCSTGADRRSGAVAPGSAAYHLASTPTLVANDGTGGPDLRTRPIGPRHAEPADRTPTRAQAGAPDRAPTRNHAGASARDEHHPRPPLFGDRHTPAYTSPWKLPTRPVQPAVAADDANIGALGVLAASVVGTGHRCAEPAEPRQDAYRLARDETGRHLIVAVADGISSCRFSDLGAQVAVTTAVNAVRQTLGTAHGPDALDRLDAMEMFQSVAQRMLATAEERGVRPHDVGVVLIVAVVPTRSDAPDGSRQVWIAHVGDVSAWRLRHGAWEPFVGGGKAQHGGLESGEIDAALPWAPGAVEAGRHTVPAHSTLAFVTDGMGDAFHGNRPLNRHFARHWSGKPPITSFLNDMHFDAPSCQDDRTAVVVWTDRADR
ncbi:protein phosphatase 2C domain-containing protein [Streptomyces cavernae]|uniref:protein phosphatase 2C domain-containing protein n=1 Tax=Streptomyces cavernae TaxID=2259034 RepID=UPI000FEBB65F|nr:protein phosphatase 2C domain-containing protein [Streptomyces cavernae]